MSFVHPFRASWPEPDMEMGHQNTTSFSRLFGISVHGTEQLYNRTLILSSRCSHVRYARIAHAVQTGASQLPCPCKYPCNHVPFVPVQSRPDFGGTCPSASRRNPQPTVPLDTQPTSQCLKQYIKTSAVFLLQNSLSIHSTTMNIQFPRPERPQGPFDLQAASRRCQTSRTLAPRRLSPRALVIS
ncbi:unnamed protein product [Periconia digitata]|uniref:Uncharacterized protein n=1 Tax=Periconia digitata TaxID=1303443 RepID=A0A9W4XQL5_9PLEO|nr:unnamed protein product [Periconia digitata]